MAVEGLGVGCGVAVMQKEKREQQMVNLFWMKEINQIEIVLMKKLRLMKHLEFQPRSLMEVLEWVEVEFVVEKDVKCNLLAVMEIKILMKGNCWEK